MNVNVLRWEQHGPDIMAVFAIQNPVTRNMVTLKPPIEIRTKDEADMLAEWIKAYCKEAWKTLLDPKVIDASTWRDGDPAGV